MIGIGTDRVILLIHFFSTVQDDLIIDQENSE